MPDDTHHHHHHSDKETGPFIHRAHHLIAPTAAIAATLTVFHDKAVSLPVGAVTFWLLTFLFVFLGSTHDWRACSLCHEPPKALATEEARTRLARRAHSRIIKRPVLYLLVAIAAHALLPKPYMDPWWAKALAGAVYFVTALLFAVHAKRVGLHELAKEDCHIEWCRAGLMRKPGMTWERRYSMWKGHHGVWILGVLAPATYVTGLYSMQHRTLGWQILYGLLLIGMLSVILSMAIDHSMEPCTHCARSLPSNGGESAERRMPLLRLFHVTRSIALTAAAFACIASWALAGTVTAKLLIFCMAVLILFWAVLDRLHSPVKPWCPWCKDDGGEEEAADVPDPADNVPTPA